MPTKTQRDSSVKRDAILNAAGLLFSQQGYEETTIADIAKAAGIAVGTVYLYFRNKHEIYTGVALSIDILIAQAFVSLDLANLPFTEVPRAMVDSVFRINHEYMHLMPFLQANLLYDEDVRRYKETHQQTIEALTNIFQHAIDRDELAPFNTEMYAQMLYALGGDILHQCFVIERGEREEMYRTYLTEFVERLFFGPSLHEGYKAQNR